MCLSMNPYVDFETVYEMENPKQRLQRRDTRYKSSTRRLFSVRFKQHEQSFFVFLYSSCSTAPLLPPSKAPRAGILVHAHFTLYIRNECKRHDALREWGESGDAINLSRRPLSVGRDVALTCAPANEGQRLERVCMTCIWLLRASRWGLQ